MELSILLAQVFGIYMIIMGVSMIIKQRNWKHVMRDMDNHWPALYGVVMAELLVGLFLVMTHNIWVKGPEVIVTIIGWLTLIEGAAYMLLPDKSVAKIIKNFTTRSMIMSLGIISLVVGIYLTHAGFNGLIG